MCANIFPPRCFSCRIPHMHVHYCDITSGGWKCHIWQRWETLEQYLQLNTLCCGFGDSTFCHLLQPDCTREQWKAEQAPTKTPRMMLLAEVVVICSQGNHTWRPIPGLNQGQRIGLLVNTLTLKLQKDIGHAHQLAPQCLWTYSWAECCDGAHLCGLLTERRRWVIPAPVLSYSKCMTTGWLSKPLFQHLFNLSLLCPSLSAPRLKGAALPLFASFCLSFRQWGEWQ